MPKTIKIELGLTKSLQKLNGAVFYSQCSSLGGIVHESPKAMLKDERLMLLFHSVSMRLLSKRLLAAHITPSD